MAKTARKARIPERKDVQKRQERLKRPTWP